MCWIGVPYNCSEFGAKHVLLRTGPCGNISQMLAAAGLKITLHKTSLASMHFLTGQEKKIAPDLGRSHTAHLPRIVKSPVGQENTPDREQNTEVHHQSHKQHTANHGKNRCPCKPTIKDWWKSILQPTKKTEYSAWLPCICNDSVCLSTRVSTCRICSTLRVREHTALGM